MSRRLWESPREEEVREKAHSGYRIFIGDIGTNIGKVELSREFRGYGPINDIWVARNPAGFAFMVFKYSSDAESAVRHLNSRPLCGRRVRAEIARPYRQARKPRYATVKSTVTARYGNEPASSSQSRRSHSRSRDERSRSREHRRTLSRSPSTESRHARWRSRSYSPVRRRSRSPSDRSRTFSGGCPNCSKHQQDMEEDRNNNESSGRHRSQSRSSRSRSQFSDRHLPSNNKAKSPASPDIKRNEDVHMNERPQVFS